MNPVLCNVEGIHLHGDAIYVFCPFKLHGDLFRLFERHYPFQLLAVIANTDIYLPTLIVYSEASKCFYVMDKFGLIWHIGTDYQIATKFLFQRDSNYILAVDSDGLLFIFRENLEHSTFWMEIYRMDASPFTTRPIEIKALNRYSISGIYIRRDGMYFQYRSGDRSCIGTLKLDRQKRRSGVRDIWCDVEKKLNKTKIVSNEKTELREVQKQYNNTGFYVDWTGKIYAFNSIKESVQTSSLLLHSSSYQLVALFPCSALSSWSHKVLLEPVHISAPNCFRQTLLAFDNRLNHLITRISWCEDPLINIYFIN